MKAAQKRILLEATEGPKLAATADVPSSNARETAIVKAWQKWYAEAIRSTSRLVVGAVSPEFEKRLELLAASLSIPER